MSRKLWLIVGPVAMIVLGCRPAAEPPPQLTAPSGVQVRVVDEKQYGAALAEQRGKVVLVDFWATWCDPCRRLFPHTVELQRRYADRGLVVITVSLDNPAEEPQVLDFLDQQKAQSLNFISRYGTGTRSVEAFQVGQGAIPHVKLYDRQGKLQKVFGEDDPPDPSRIEAAVKQLLDAASG